MVNKVNCGSDTARGRKIGRSARSAAGLVVNIIVLWNTLYINGALEQLAREGYNVTSEDVACSSSFAASYGEILEVMPWPYYRFMTGRDLDAVYSYLSAIPSASPGECNGFGE